MSSIALIQLATLPLSESRLDYYLKICKDKGAELILLGEYVLNSFFKELELMPKNMITRQSSEKKQSLISLSKKYDLDILAPLVLPKNGGLVKGVARFSKGVFRFCEQQILMPYSHWNEAKFFANKSEKLNFMSFTYKDLKIGVMFGYETHFDASFLSIMKKNIDVLLVPTASTFDSNARWEELLKFRAFCNGISVIRANRIGSYKVKNPKIEGEENWKFYGDSFVITPLGQTSQRLGKDEGVLIANIDKKELIKARNIWNFKTLQKKDKFII
ncbi:MAG: carbon-nitrogen hydrolase family protein [Campylobacter sp.]|nr:carbon-nitrogen hydrolase family protein [Campylobacter sp.]